MNEETRVRQRYGPDRCGRPPAISRTRIAVVRAVGRPSKPPGSFEVETPDAADAGRWRRRGRSSPFNAPDTDSGLRIAPELFLKRCVVGGFDKVFELNRNFRKRGRGFDTFSRISMLETYQAYGDYEDSARITREVIQGVADEAIGTRQVPLPDGSGTTRRGMVDVTNVSPLSAALDEEITDFGRTPVADCRPIGSRAAA